MHAQQEKPLHLFDAIFQPQSIAIVGASPDDAKWGGRVLSLLDECKFDGRVYPINRKLSDINGLTCYSSLANVGEPVDLVMICVPAANVPAVIDECVMNRSTVAQIISSGFSEVGDAGQDLQNEIVSRARRGRVRLIGPNCMGIYSATGRLSMTAGAHHHPGTTSVVSQSGGLSTDLLLTGQELGLRFNKIVSVGNCVDLDCADFVEHFLADPKTTAIGVYIESTKDGRHLRDVLCAGRELGKPIVLLKGGRTSAGTRSVSSHTGRLAGSYAVWQALCKQASVVEVTSVQEFLSALLAVQCWTSVAEGGVAFLGNGGGASVLATDACEEMGLPVARFSEQTRAEVQLRMREQHRRDNPIDLPTQQLIAEDGRLVADLLGICCRDSSVSAVVLHLNLGSGTFQTLRNNGEVIDKIVNNLSRVDLVGKAVGVVVRSNGAPHIESARVDIRRKLNAREFPVFMSVEDACAALRIAARTSSTSRFQCAPRNDTTDC